MTTRFDITAGPGKYDFVLALFEGKTVAFTVETLGQIDVEIVELSAAGQRMEFYFAGLAWEPTHHELEQYVRGCFDIRTRTGQIVVEFRNDESVEIDVVEQDDIQNPHLCLECHKPPSDCWCFDEEDIPHPSEIYPRDHPA